MTDTTTVQRRNRIAYSPAEAAELLGISRRSIDRAIARGDLRATKIGGVVRIAAAELDRLLGVDTRGSTAA